MFFQTESADGLKLQAKRLFPSFVKNVKLSRIKQRECIRIVTCAEFQQNNNILYLREATATDDEDEILVDYDDQVSVDYEDQLALK